MSAQTALIVGASRGIGFELARQYRTDGWRVLASVRRPADAAALEALGCEVLQLDLDDAAQCAALGERLASERLDIALLNAGVYGPQTSVPTTPTADEFDTVMHANVLGAMRLLPLLGPLVAAAGGRLAVTSSSMGSISLRSNTSGWLYRASKAALNSLLVDASLTYAPAICVALHPGWVRTAMGGDGADLDVSDSAAGMRATLAGLTAAGNGHFFNYNGAPLTW
ncbi:Dehydrogenases with different specificities (short-chain alcohol dehydrogenases-like protein) [Oxalobacteraceae bacterium IMCC9480]|nr:Dehydrogenases with different specificities (short-chain alcohol dehydrogenases-like protein) [Oxalobacteraceae bacterium IMCC9480]NDP60827.1 SDR family oxidoreductase [Oxalobacteraceae bacterium]